MDQLAKDVLRRGLRDARWHREEMTQFLGMIQRFDQTISKGEDLRKACRDLARIAIEETHFERCFVSLWDEEKRDLSLVAAFSLQEFMEGEYRFPGRDNNVHDGLDPFENIAGRVFATRNPAFIENVKEDSFHPLKEKSFRSASIASLPLLDFGVLSLSAYEPLAFSPQSKRNLEMLGKIIGYLLLGAHFRAGAKGVEELSGKDSIDIANVCPAASDASSSTIHLLERAVDSVPQGICILDPEGRVARINRSIERLHGKSAPEVIGRSPAVLFHDPMVFDKLFRKMPDSQQEEMSEVSLINSRGEIYLADVHLVRLGDEEGKADGYLLVINDTTKKKAFSEKILRNEKLVALGTMAGGVAHDFNNLLMAIMGHVQLLLPQLEDEDARRRLQNIEKAVHDGAHTIRRLQKFTERDREARVPITAVNVAEAIQDVVELTRPRWKNGMEKYGHTVQFRMELEPYSPAAIHPSDLREVITNLIFNALEAMPEGGTITLRCKALKDIVVIEVADTGIGMSKEVVGKIFDPYYTTKGIGNSGLGLSVSWSIVVRYGGEIQVKSKPGKGTVFMITLPKVETPYSVPPPSQSGQNNRSYRILVVDDEEEILGILRDMIRLKGHKVITTHDGGKALELIDTEKFDLVLTDLGMPTVSGWEIARRAKAKNPNLPVVLITGWGVQYEDEDLSDRGVDCVLSKPLSWDNLLDTINKVLPLA